MDSSFFSQQMPYYSATLPVYIALVRLCLDFPLYLLGLQDFVRVLRRITRKHRGRRNKLHIHMEDKQTKYVITRRSTLGVVLIVYL